jgi:hypothetical protein
VDRDVTHNHTVGGEFDLQGRLGNFAITDVLQMIGLSGKSGTLTLIQGWNTRTISFDRGRICYVAAGARLPRIFDLLVRTGRLQRHQVEGFRARRPAKTGEATLTELVSRQLLSREDRDRCIELLLASAGYTLVLWRNGVFTFKAGELVLSAVSRDALLFEMQLNRFAVDNKLKVRMAPGKVLGSDLDTPIGPTGLVDLYKLFIGIQHNEFAKTYEPGIAQELIEGLYLNADPEIKSMMRMYEFIEIEGVLQLATPERGNDRAADVQAS